MEKPATIFVGPGYGMVRRVGFVGPVREAAGAGFDVLIACAFNFDTHAGEFQRVGTMPVLRVRMNADLHMADGLQLCGGDLFVVFGERDIALKGKAPKCG